MTDGCLKNTPNNPETKFYKTSTWLLGRCGVGGGVEETRGK